MVTKTVHLTEDLLKSVSYRTKLEDVDESTAIRQFIRLGVMWYVVDLYKRGKITLGEAAELSGVSLRRMLDILAEHGVKGNVKMDQQIKALDYAKNL
jgi:predicted HTH domain antitoxin